MSPEAVVALSSAVADLIGTILRKGHPDPAGEIRSLARSWELRQAAEQDFRNAEDERFPR